MATLMEQTANTLEFTIRSSEGFCEYTPGTPDEKLCEQIWRDSNDQIYEMFEQMNKTMEEIEDAAEGLDLNWIITDVQLTAFYNMT